MAWDWTQYQPPPSPLSLFGLLPGMSPMETGVPGGPVTPVLPDVEKNRPPVLTGSGFMPSVTAPGIVGTGLKPGLLNFGSTAPAGTPADPDKTFKEQVLAAMNDKNFTGALALLAKASGHSGGKAPVAPGFKVSAPTHISQGKSVAGPAQQAMTQALQQMASPEFDLTQPLKRKGGVQSRYDIINKRQSSIKDLLSQLE